ncbi:MurR/RpiR family transcriptional regulator [Oryzicola mucosus]|uniref:MurR/RpiR family transcriptional regulator n=1 Tax=Oryzicola mucosus TaxID=2767425 RepID=A0A8J6U1Z0_9HYPH|nr:MurR/RpiR family transcriptional regulator [Oryzicola mucosus]MBD0415093.1 MurR/RpiR family transcriptional regulator [Oryzicola mucosus]
MDQIHPQDFDQLRALILERRETLPKRIAQVAAYALDNPDAVAFGTAASIAAEAGVQPSTLIRFAQQLGFDGFTSLQAVFRERIRERNGSYDERLRAVRARTEQGAGNRAVLEGFVAAAQTSLNDMLRGVDEAQLEKAVSLLAAAETIHIVAQRRSYAVATSIAYALGKLKVRSQIIESAAGLQAEMLGFATERDVVLAISFAPYAPTTMEYLRMARDRGVPVVAITDSAFSPLARNALIWFEVTESDFSGFRSLAATMTLSMALSVMVAERRGE